MRSEIWTLAKLELQTSLGLNEARHSSSKTNKRYAAKNGLVFFLSVLMLLVYSSSFSVTVALSGAGETIPVYLLMALTAFLAFFSFVNSGAKFFNMETYEKLIILPVKPSSIIGARFLVMLLENEVYSLAICLPGLITYGIVLHPAFSFYPLALLIILLAPLLPMTIASILGVFFTGLFSKTRHKNIITSIFSIILVIAIVAGSFFFSNRSSSPSEDAASLITGANSVTQYYFMAKWAKEAWVNYDWLSLLYFALTSLASYALFTSLTSWKFVPICLSLQEKRNSKKFVMGKQKGSSQIWALAKKDLKMYLNSRIYLTNTIIGYLFWVIFSIILPFLPGWMGLTNIEGFSGSLTATYPFISAFFVMTGSTTSIALSYEAKQWWLTCSLPIKNKTVYASKVLMNFLVFLPFYVLSTILFCSLSKTDATTYISAILFPPVFVLANGYFGLWINIHFPKFNWTNETQVVKNSSSSVISMLINMVFLGGPIVAFFFVKESLVRFGISMALLVLAVIFGLFFFWRVNKKELKDIAGD